MVMELNELLAEIRRLQEQVEQRWDLLRARFNYSLEGRRVRFAEEARNWQRRYRIGLGRYLLGARPLNVLTAPVIYTMVIPLALCDLCITIFQHVCFRAYGVPRVGRRDYFVIDRHHLQYLNGIEKFNCVYCGYANGLISYAREIIARTEQYWCPIKHARRIRAAHEHYANFTDYGDAKAWREELPRQRRALAGEGEETQTSPAADD